MNNRSLTIIILALTPFFSFAQNPMFCGWGLSKSTALNTLSEITGAVFSQKIQSSNILATYKEASFSYTFNRSSLYEISMEKTFSEKKPANQSFDNCLAYFSAVRAELVSKRVLGKELCEFVFASQGKVYWLVIKRYGKRMSQIRLICRDLTQTPLGLWSDVEYKVAREIGLGRQEVCTSIVKVLPKVENQDY